MELFLTINLNKEIKMKELEKYTDLEIAEHLFKGFDAGLCYATTEWDDDPEEPYFQITIKETSVRLHFKNDRALDWIGLCTLSTISKKEGEQS